MTGWWKSKGKEEKRVIEVDCPFRKGLPLLWGDIVSDVKQYG